MRTLSAALALLLAAAAATAGPAPTRLGLKGTQLTINDEPTFLLGMSYYGGLGAPEDTVRHDLDELKKHGFNWIRVWATWAAFGADVSAVAVDGKPRPEFLKKLRWLVSECDRRGFIVDVTLSRSNGITGPPRLQSLEVHRQAVTTLVGALQPLGNWYLDLGNERNIKDKRFVSFDDLKDLRALVRALDPPRLVTASHAGDIGPGDLDGYLRTALVDFVSPHRPRTAASPGQTEARTRALLASMQDRGRLLPIHYQEPFRRGFGAWQPGADDYVKDLAGARSGGAAGWCFHNGDRRAAQDGQPRRSFDLRSLGLFEQLDDTERATLKSFRND